MTLRWGSDLCSIGSAERALPLVWSVASHSLSQTTTADCLSRATQDDDAKVKEAGARVGTLMCRALIEAGVRGLHFYTLNLEKVTYTILKDLGLYHEIEGEAALD